MKKFISVSYLFILFNLLFPNQMIVVGEVFTESW